MRYTINEAQAWQPPPDPRGLDYVASWVVRVLRDGQRLFLVRSLIERTDMWAVMHRAGLTRNDADDETRFKDVLLRYTVARVEGELAAGAPLVDAHTSEIQNYILGEADLPDLVALFVADRPCSYQVRDGRELVCHAAASDDPGSVAVAGTLKHIGPTSTFLCNECSLPRNEVLCSHLIHPQVRAVQAERGPMGQVLPGMTRRTLKAATCDIGRAEIEDPTRCMLGGHECGERFVDDIKSADATELPPTAVNDAFGYLDTTWRAAFGGRHRLVVANITTAGGLSLPCSDADDFRLRLIDVGDTLARLEVQHDLYDTDTRVEVETTSPPPGSLEKIERLLRERLADEPLNRALAALGVLRAVASLRSTHAAHPGSPDARKAALRLGLPYPPQSWHDAWSAIKSHTVQALSELREAVGTLLT